MERTGITLVQHSLVERLERTAGGITIHYAVSADSEAKRMSQLEVECVLWAIGRRPNVEVLQLQNARVKTGKSGHIEVDTYQNTSAEGVLAIGDVCGHAELTPGKQQQ